MLEARACGVTVLVAEDNPKLQSLRGGPLYTTLFTRGQLNLACSRSRRRYFGIEMERRVRRRRRAWWRRRLLFERRVPRAAARHALRRHLKRPPRRDCPLTLCRAVGVRVSAPKANSGHCRRHGPPGAASAPRRARVGGGVRRRCWRFARHPGRQVRDAAAATAGAAGDVVAIKSMTRRPRAPEAEASPWRRRGVVRRVGQRRGAACLRAGGRAGAGAATPGAGGLDAGTAGRPRAAASRRAARRRRTFVEPLLRHTKYHRADAPRRRRAIQTPTTHPA